MTKHAEVDTPNILRSNTGMKFAAADSRLPGHNNFLLNNKTTLCFDQHNALVSIGNAHIKKTSNARGKSTDAD